MEQTTFYVIGIALVILALAVTAIGMRYQGFPSRAGLRAGLLIFTAVVAVTMAAAIVAARDEQARRLEEENREASQEAAAEEEAAEESQADEGAGEAASPEPGAPPADVALGEEVFASAGCGSCHVLEAAGTTGQIGPNLDDALIAQDPAFIREAIVDPDAVVAEGFAAGSMPGFEQDLSPEELDALVAFISEATSAGN